MLRRENVVLCVVLLIGYSSHQLAAQDRPDLCLQALKVAAYNEYKVNQTSSSDERFHHAFCDAVHTKEQDQSETSGDLLTAAFFLSLKNDQSSLKEYEHTYCETTSYSSRYDLEYSFWKRVVNGDALAEFNKCMEIATPTSGLIGGSKALGQCGFEATIKFVPASPKNQQFARMSKDAALINADCKTIPYKNQKIDEAGMPITCKRFGRDDSFIVLFTDQGPYTIAAPSMPAPEKPAAIPAPPLWDDNDPKTNQPFSQDFIVAWPSQMAGGQCSPGGAGWTNCSGTLSVAPAGVITSVSYVCSSGYTDKGDQFCHWSYNRLAEKGRDPDVSVNGANFTWYRRYNTSSGMSETYHVQFKMPHQKNAIEQQYDQAMQDYQARVKENVCPWKPSPPSSSHWFWPSNK